MISFRFSCLHCNLDEVYNCSATFISVMLFSVICIAVLLKVIKFCDLFFCLVAVCVRYFAL